MHKIMIMLLSGTLVTMSVPAEAVAGPQFGNALHDNAFDQAGAAQPGATLEYDAANRLRRVKRGSLDIRYIYDGVGNLEAEIVDDGQKVTRTDLLVDESGPLPRVIGALTDDGARELYAYGPMGVAMVRKSAAGQPPATYHALTDEMGTVRGLANEAGALAGRVAYGPFGRVRVTEGEQTRLAFAGEYRDTAGLVWLRARHYAPFLGRFVQRDTVVDDPGNPQSLNRYTYAANNPLSNLDPTGHTVLAVAVVSVVLIVLFVGTLIGANVTMVRNPGGKDPELRRQEALWVEAHGIATGMAGTAAGAHGAASAARARSAALGASRAPGSPGGAPMENLVIKRAPAGQIHPDWLDARGDLKLDPYTVQMLAQLVNPTGTTYGNCGDCSTAGYRILNSPRVMLPATAKAHGPTNNVDRPYEHPPVVGGKLWKPGSNDPTRTENFMLDQFVTNETPHGGVGAVDTSAYDGRLGPRQDHAVTAGICPSGEAFLVDFQRGWMTTNPSLINQRFPLNPNHEYFNGGVDLYAP